MVFNLVASDFQHLEPSFYISNFPGHFGNLFFGPPLTPVLPFLAKASIFFSTKWGQVAAAATSHLPKESFPRWAIPPKERFWLRFNNRRRSGLDVIPESYEHLWEFSQRKWNCDDNVIKLKFINWVGAPEAAGEGAEALGQFPDWKFSKGLVPPDLPRSKFMVTWDAFRLKFYNW